MGRFLSPHASSVLLGDRRCTATARSTGERCGRASARGQFTCDHHGAKNPLSIAAGRRRLLELAEPALEVLDRATRSAPPCEVCGRSDADRDPVAVRAAGMILDRCGFGPSVNLDVRRAPEGEDLSHLSSSELADRLEELAREARAAAGAEPAGLLDAPVVEGYPVPEDDDVRSSPPEVPPMEDPNA
jgi:hypothetical protein